MHDRPWYLLMQSRNKEFEPEFHLCVNSAEAFVGLRAAKGKHFFTPSRCLKTKTPNPLRIRGFDCV
jgi:hypothetical protein